MTEGWLTEIYSPFITCVQCSGGCDYMCGKYHEYTGGCSVHWRITSMHWRVFSAFGGYQYCSVIPPLFFWYPPPTHTNYRIPQCTCDIPPMHWTSPMYSWYLPMHWGYRIPQCSSHMLYRKILMLMVQRTCEVNRMDENSSFIFTRGGSTFIRQVCATGVLNLSPCSGVGKPKKDTLLWSYHSFLIVLYCIVLYCVRDQDHVYTLLI